MKRKRNGGDSMPTIRERIDEDTGRIITVQIETTKEAKKRRKTATAQWVPTAGEINAADLWNKQEEKIKRDKEREERKKKVAARQAEKDAKAKELQEELLRKGKISIEDTWGKVSLSQNRLSKFFGPPNVFKQPVKQSVGFKNGNRLQESESIISENNVAMNEHANEGASANDNLSAFTTGFSLTQQSPVRVHSRLSERNTGGEQGKSLMLPPPTPRRPLQRVSSPSSQIDAETTSSASNRKSPGKPTRTTRRVLSQMTASELNIKSAGHSILLSSKDEESQHKPAQAVPISTQIMMETLDGISSQDLIDDFSEDAASDKENSQPECVSNKSSLYNTTPQVYGTKVDSHCLRPHKTAVSFDEFGDDRIDDETLLYFAATQRINSGVERSPGKNISSKSPKLSREFPCDVQESVSRTKLVRSPITTTKQQAAGDSFAFTDVDDEDLLECLKEFEDDTDGIDDEDLLEAVEKFEEANGPGEKSRPQKKRRVLPWVKNPVLYSTQETVEDPYSATQSFQDY